MKSASYKNLSREQRLAWARGILAEHDQHSDARVRRACKTVLNHAPRSESFERLNARCLLDSRKPVTEREEAKA